MSVSACTSRTLKLRPGPGWSRLSSSVWEHTSGARIHVLGFVKLPNGAYLDITRWDQGRLGRELERINGGNRRRGLMAWAVNIVEDQAAATPDGSFVCRNCCRNCGARIDGRTDDHYNISHTQIKCPECGKWNDAK